MRQLRLESALLQLAGFSMGVIAAQQGGHELQEQAPHQAVVAAAPTYEQMGQVHDCDVRRLSCPGKHCSLFLWVARPRQRCTDRPSTSSQSMCSQSKLVSRSVWGRTIPALPTAPLPHLHLPCCELQLPRGLPPAAEPQCACLGHGPPLAAGHPPAGKATEGAAGDAPDAARRAVTSGAAGLGHR